MIVVRGENVDRGNKMSQDLHLQIYRAPSRNENTQNFWVRA